jgi:hypothetical protein
LIVILSFNLNSSINIYLVDIKTVLQWIHFLKNWLNLRGGFLAVNVIEIWKHLKSHQIIRFWSYQLRISTLINGWFAKALSSQPLSFTGRNKFWILTRLHWNFYSFIKKLIKQRSTLILLLIIFFRKRNHISFQAIFFKVSILFGKWHLIGEVHRINRKTIMFETDGVQNVKGIFMILFTVWITEVENVDGLLSLGITLNVLIGLCNLPTEKTILALWVGVLSKF